VGDAELGMKKWGLEKFFFDRDNDRKGLMVRSHNYRQGMFL
jgi:hypothetical protein